MLRLALSVGGFKAVDLPGERVNERLLLTQLLLQRLVLLGKLAQLLLRLGRVLGARHLGGQGRAGERGGIARQTEVVSLRHDGNKGATAVPSAGGVGERRTRGAVKSCGSPL